MGSAVQTNMSTSGKLPSYLQSRNHERDLVLQVLVYTGISYEEIYVLFDVEIRYTGLSYSIFYHVHIDSLITYTGISYKYL